MAHRALLLLTAAASLALLACRSDSAATGREESLAITGVTVIDGTGAPPKADQTIVISDGRIVALGPVAEIRIPRRTTTVDGRGKYLIPGLWDLHVHLHFATEAVLPVFVSHGVTGIRDLNTAIPEVRRLRQSAAGGTLVSPRLIGSGSMIEAGIFEQMLRTAAPPIVREMGLRDRIFVTTAEDARQAVDSLAKLRPDLLKLHLTVDRDVYRATLAAAASAGLPVAGHFPSGLSLREVVDAGQNTIEHRIELDRIAASFAVETEAARADLIARIRATGTAFVPTLVDIGPPEYRGGNAGDNLARAREDPRVRFISASMWQSWEGLLSMNGPGDEPEPSYAEAAGFLTTLHRAGVPILAGTDFGAPFLFPGSSLHEELGELVRQLGMTPVEAIRSATGLAARQLGLADSLGTVEPGKLADLVLLGADPAREIANIGRVEGVFLRGRHFDRPALDRLEAKAAATLRR